MYRNFKVIVLYIDQGGGQYVLSSKGLEKVFFQNILGDDSELERAPEGPSPYGISFADGLWGKDLISPRG